MIEYGNKNSFSSSGNCFGKEKVHKTHELLFFFFFRDIMSLKFLLLLIEGMRYNTTCLGFMLLAWDWWRSLECWNFTSHCAIHCICISSTCLLFSKFVCRLGKNQHLYLFEVNCWKLARMFDCCCLSWLIIFDSFRFCLSSRSKAFPLTLRPFSYFWFISVSSHSCL